MMKLIHSIFLKLFCINVGSDQYGNTYYVGKKVDSFGRKKRYCLFSGRVEASKISPEWHLFMHYQIDAQDVVKYSKKHNWQKPAIPSITLSDVKYLPKGHLLYSNKGDLFKQDASINPFKIKFWNPDL